MKTQVTRQLVCMAFSPWSEQASWTLDHHGVPYKRHIYTPMVELPWLRVRTGRWRGPVTVPVLIENKKVWADSWEIAQHAEANGQGIPLFAPGKEHELKQWNARCQAALAEGRLRVIERTARSQQALVESVPVRVPKAFDALAKNISLVGCRYLKKKYHKLAQPGALRATLDEIRAALNGTASGYVLGNFSYADIVAAMTLHFVEPPAPERIPLGPATRVAWRDPELADEYRDLIKWRDALYRNHRPERAR